MKKEYVSPVLTSLRYMFAENVAADTSNPYGDMVQSATGLVPTAPTEA